MFELCKIMPFYKNEEILNLNQMIDFLFVNGDTRKLKIIVELLLYFIKFSDV